LGLSSLSTFEVSLDSDNQFIHDLIGTDKGVIKIYGYDYSNLNEVYSSIFNEKSTAYFMFALCFRFNKGVVPGAAFGLSFQKTQERALLEMFNHLSALESIECGKLVPSGSILDQRLINFGTIESLTNEVKSVIDQSLQHYSKENFYEIKLPEIVFSNLIHGPWDPEVIVSRVILDGSVSLSDGDSRRFIF
jgi:hypothetical protein